MVEWHHNGAVMESVSVASTRENLTSLNLVNIQQSGVYQCRIINKYGRDLASVHVCVEEEGMYVCVYVCMCVYVCTYMCM